MIWNSRVARTYLVYIVLQCVFAVGRFLKRLSFCKGILQYAFNNISRHTMCVENYWDSLFTEQMLRNVWHCVLLDMNKKVKQGGRALNTPLASPDGQRYYRLLDLAKGSRPMVVNFGSCTCPIFMSALNEFRTLVSDFKDIADFLVVYVEEAHPMDGWAFKGNHPIPCHRTQEERCRAARILTSANPPCSVMIDTMLNATNIAYGAAPIRLYIIQEATVVYEGGSGPMGYRMENIRTWLNSNMRNYRY